MTSCTGGGNRDSPEGGVGGRGASSSGARFSRQRHAPSSRFIKHRRSEHPGRPHRGEDAECRHQSEEQDGLKDGYKDFHCSVGNLST